MYKIKFESNFMIYYFPFSKIVLKVQFSQSQVTYI